ncbi:MAG: hypothetical protein H6682_14560 [Candidatus Eisenbacteria bacterium]|nr:hypothetical protein [Candidatus Eisenbacteria bacterium]
MTTPSATEDTKACRGGRKAFANASFCRPAVPWTRCVWVCAAVLAASFATPVVLGSARGESVQRGTVVFELPRLAQLQISGDLSGLLALDADGTGESSYDVGSVTSAVDANVLTVTATDAWDLSARLSGDWTCPGTYDRPETDLLIRVTNADVGTIENGASSFISLATTDTMILSDGSAVSGNAVDIQTRVLLDWESDVPGAYAISVTYTLVGHVP